MKPIDKLKDVLETLSDLPSYSYEDILDSLIEDLEEYVNEYEASHRSEEES